jgi:hypothetical protein
MRFFALFMLVTLSLYKFIFIEQKEVSVLNLQHGFSHATMHFGVVADLHLE